MSWGDFPLGETLNHFFTTRAFATGIPTVLAGTPGLSVYEDTNLTQITAGVTVTVDVDSVVGLNRANIVATSGNGYETGKSYVVVISTGTVGGVSVVGEVVGEFTVERSAAFARIGAPAGSSVSADIAAIEAQTDDIGVAGAGLTAIPTQDSNVIQWLGTAVAPPTVAGVPEVDVTHMAGGVQTVTDLKDFADDGYDPVANKVQGVVLVDTTTANTDMRGTDSGALASEVTAARMSELDAATGGKMANQVDIIQTDTTTDIPGTISTLQSDTSSILTDTGTTIPGTISTLQSDTDDIQTRLPAALVSGRIDSSVGAMEASVLTSTVFATSAINANTLSPSAVDEIRDGLLPTQNAAFSNIMFLFVAASDHVTPVTGASGTSVTRSIDGAAFGSGTGTLAEVANGMYQYDASAADMNGGVITFRFVATGGTPGAPDDSFVTIVTGGGV